jgi:NAD-dependent DNA ligase
MAVEAMKQPRRKPSDSLEEMRALIQYHEAAYREGRREISDKVFDALVTRYLKAASEAKP